MNDLEKKIKEQRTIEATKKGYTGIGGKFGVIVRTLGQPIIDHSEGGVYLSKTYLDDPYQLPVDNDLNGPPEYIQKQIPYMDVVDNEEPTGTGWRSERDYTLSPITATEIGYNFDGLSRGMHLEINYSVDKNELSVYYKGYIVFRETNGELESYVPLVEWEQLIDKLYSRAVEIEKQKRKVVKQEKIVEVQKAKKSFLEKIKNRWGIT